MDRTYLFSSSRKSVIPLAPFDGTYYNLGYYRHRRAKFITAKNSLGSINSIPRQGYSNSEATGKENTFDGLRD